MPLTFLVGPNGSGKSNFLDGLRFVSDAFNSSLEQALHSRGGIQDVRRRSAGRPTHVGVRLDVQASAALTGHYSFRIGSRAGGGYVVQAEECVLRDTRKGKRPSESHFVIRNGELVSKTGRYTLPTHPERLTLPALAGLPDFGPLVETFRLMSFYNIDTSAMREPQLSDEGAVLRRDASNIASVLRRMRARRPSTLRRIEEYLAQIMPGFVSVEAQALGRRETLMFRQKFPSESRAWEFAIEGMSEGTLRALGILAALFQGGVRRGTGVPLVAVEEPELNLHIAASGVLLDAIREASERTQVLVTSHSADLLNDDEIESSSLMAVLMRDGASTIAPLDRTGLTALRERLYTPGELLRLNQLRPDTSRGARGAASSRLFDKLSAS